MVESRVSGKMSAKREPEAPTAVGPLPPAVEAVLKRGAVINNCGFADCFADTVGFWKSRGFSVPTCARAHAMKGWAAPLKPWVAFTGQG
jgi:hypothetical protein